MAIQIIKDSEGNQAGVFIPILDWNKLTQKFKGLKKLIEPTRKKSTSISDLAGKLSKKTGEDMLKHVEESRNEWEERLVKQFSK